MIVPDKAYIAGGSFTARVVVEMLQAVSGRKKG
jgi:hypothetical protein